MALQSQAQLLDELMGKNRNVAPGVRINSIRFDDEDVSGLLMIFWILKFFYLTKFQRNIYNRYANMHCADFARMIFS